MHAEMLDNRAQGCCMGQHAVTNAAMPGTLTVPPLKPCFMYAVLGRQGQVDDEDGYRRHRHLLDRTLYDWKSLSYQQSVQLV